MSTVNLSYLDLIDKCDNCRVNRPSPLPEPSPFDTEKLVSWCLSPEPTSPAIGLLRPVITDILRRENEQSRQNNRPELWHIESNEDGVSRVTFQAWANTIEKRTTAMKELCERWRDTGLFEDICGPKKWRAEMYPVYQDPFSAHDYPANGQTADEAKMNYAFEMERSVCALFGVVTYGIHMTAFERGPDGDSWKIWVPTRSKTKQTFPGLYDNTVAGGIPSGMGMFESLVKECMEEASIDETVVRKYVRATGSISYFFRTSKGWLQPEIEYVYDLEIPQGADPALFQPKPSDGEVECFELLEHAEVIQRMKAGRFKPNCALVLIDFFIRFGFINPDNEPSYQKIITRLHGEFDYDRW